MCKDNKSVQSELELGIKLRPTFADTIDTLKLETTVSTQHKT